ncbi:MAG: cobalamin-binding protein [Cyanobacteria bacterium J06621_11]
MLGNRDGLRIVSLIPSATEIVSALGYGDYLVGRSHECDFPASVQTLPICTEPKFDPDGSSRQVHERVTELLSVALSVYRVDVELLAKLRPTHIITQAQCEVCAVSLSDVEQAVATLGEAGEPPIEIVSLQPVCLADVWTDMQRVSAALSVYSTPDRDVAQNKTLDSDLNSSAQGLINGLKARLPSSSVTQSTEKSHSENRPKVVCIEWTDPLMAAGNWVPELVALAGGEDVCGQAGQHSDWMSWEALSAADPDIIVVIPCGYDLAQTRQATKEMSTHAAWPKLSAVKSGQVYLTDGNQYFNRPGPRLVDSYEILAEIIQGRTVDSNRNSVGWERF